MRLCLSAEQSDDHPGSSKPARRPSTGVLATGRPRSPQPTRRAVAHGDHAGGVRGHAGGPVSGGGVPPNVGTIHRHDRRVHHCRRRCSGPWGCNTGAQWIVDGATESHLRLPGSTHRVPEPENPVPSSSRRCAENFESRVSATATRTATATSSPTSASTSPGGSLAIVGETGSGKSSLSLLLVRLADPTAGRITLDGIASEDMDSGTLASLVGIVTQETYLSHASIRDNLLLAKRTPRTTNCGRCSSRTDRRDHRVVGAGAGR